MARRREKIRIFSALEVSNLCGVVHQTAINWIRNGHLKAFMTPGGQYRIYAHDLTEFLESRGMAIPDKFLEELRDDVDWKAILIVDDDEDLVDLLSRYLQRMFRSHSILKAYDGFEAGKLLSERRPGYVFLDIGLPGIDGHVICKRVKEEPSFGKPFVIAVSGMLENEVRDAILSEGADAFLPKPLDFTQAVDILNDFMGKVKLDAGNQ